MALEEPLKKTPEFDTYKDMKKIADDESLKYFKKWVEVVNLEQSASQVGQYNGLIEGEKGVIKDCMLKMINVEIVGE